MKNSSFYAIFISLFLLWGYWYPYQWWLKYGLPEISINMAQASTPSEDSKVALPDPFWGSSLAKKNENSNQSTAVEKTSKEMLSFDYSGAMMEEVKSCFKEGPLIQVNKSSGDMNHFLSTLQSELGPIQEDLMLEKKATLTMKDGKSRTLVYEWISPEEGSDVYWHETDEEGYPRPVDLPDGTTNDISSFEQLKSMGTSGKVTETRLVQLENGVQIGVEKVNDMVESLSIKDEGHLIKCRKDAAKNYVCDCLN